MLEFWLEACQVILICFWQTLCAIFRTFVPPKPKNVSGEIVLITGAGSGLGRLLALKFASLGSVVVCCDINKKGNDDTVNEIESLGGEAYGYIFDCSRREEVYSVADKIRTDVGDVTILVNNAGIVSGKKFLDNPDHMVQKTFEVNTIAHFWTIKAFLPSMIENDHGHIVSIASAAGLGGVNGLCDYCASKFAAVGIQEALFLELKAQKKSNIHTTVICPYYINTGMFDGIKTRFPSILPILDADWAANKMIKAVLANQVLLVLPKSLYLLLVLKSILPVSVNVTLADFFGFSKSMDDFKGREGNKDD